MLKQLLLTSLFIILFIRANGQDIQYSQYYANPLYLNPAFSGSTNMHRLVVNHRLQWPNLPKAFANYSASYDYNATGLNSGFGLLINSDVAGSASLRSNLVSFNYAYNIQLQDKWVIKPAVAFGWVNRTIDYEKLVFGDQIDFGMDGAPTQDPAISSIEANSYMDIATGFLAYNQNFWFGFSVFHVNEPNNSLINGQSIVPMKFSIHSGTRFELGNRAFRSVRKVSLAPGFIYKRQGDNQQLDVGTSIYTEPILFGVWYRGVPFTRNVAGFLNQDAVVFVLGVEFKQIQFGYSFDANISGLGPETGGAHEFSLQYNFETASNPNKVSRRKKFLPCPAFFK